MGLGFEVRWLDCSSVAFIVLFWLFGAKKKKEKENEEKEKKEKKRVMLIRYSLHWYLGLVWFVNGIRA